MQYLLCGVGGQGTISLSKILLEIGRRSGRHVIGSEIHGMAKRGGSVSVHVKIGEYYSPLIGEGMADVVIGLDDKEAFLNLSFLKEGGYIVVNNTHLVDWDDPKVLKYLNDRAIKRYMVDAYKMCQERCGSIRPSNTLILGLTSSLCPEEVDYSLAREVLRDVLKPRVVDMNLKALEIGYKEIGGDG